MYIYVYELIFFVRNKNLKMYWEILRRGTILKNLSGYEPDKNQKFVRIKNYQKIRFVRSGLQRSGLTRIECILLFKFRKFKLNTFVWKGYFSILERSSTRTLVNARERTKKTHLKRQ